MWYPPVLPECIARRLRAIVIPLISPTSWKTFIHHHYWLLLMICNTHQNSHNTYSLHEFLFPFVSFFPIYIYLWQELSTDKIFWAGYRGVERFLSFALFFILCLQFFAPQLPKISCFSQNPLARRALYGVWSLFAVQIPKTELGFVLKLLIMSLEPHKDNGISDKNLIAHQNSVNIRNLLWGLP